MPLESKDAGGEREVVELVVRLDVPCRATERLGHGRLVEVQVVDAAVVDVVVGEGSQ